MEKAFLFKLSVFIGWTFTSFACHCCAKLFLEGFVIFMKDAGYKVIILTAMQMTFCFILTSISDTEMEMILNKLVILITHACASFATNCSMAVTYAASTFAIKLMEPLTSSLTQRLCLGVSLSYIQWFTIPVIVFGAIVFAEDSTNRFLYISYGSILAFISNICLAVRNVYMKKKHLSNSKLLLKNIRWLSSCLLLSTVGMVMVCYLVEIKIAPSESVYLYGLLIASSLFHVSYSYISTVIVLKHISVVDHSFGNILKRLFVIALLYLTGSRSASTWNFIGLFTCVIGLLVYFWSKYPTSDKSTLCPEIPTSNNEEGKVELLVMTMYAVVILGLGFLSKLDNPGSFISSLRRTEKQNTFNSVGRPINVSNKLYNPESNITFSRPPYFSIDDFLALDLVEYPEEANKLSPLLRKMPDVIDEAQRIHMNVFKTLLGRYKYAFLLNISPSENKGDSAIVVGEVILLRKLKINVIFSCPLPCIEDNLDTAEVLSKNYSNEELVILLQGGGSIIGWPEVDYSHSKQFPRFKRFQIIMFPQGILYIKTKSHIDFCKKVYASHPRLTFVWRDSESYFLGKELFPKVHSLLTPDIAFQVGFVTRFMAPIYDILWLKRTDKESPLYETPRPTDHYRIHVSDWLQWKTQPGTSSMENAFLRTTTGLMFLQRGRIVITDRLHGHILSILLGIPHIFIDNRYHKISNYRNTWTAGIDNVVLAKSSSDALAKARQLLKDLDNDLPEIKGFY